MSQVVIVVDDDEGVRDFLKSVLELQGYKVMVVGTIAELELALEVVQAGNDTLLAAFVDGMLSSSIGRVMSDKDGREAARKVKKAFPGTPVIAISSQHNIQYGDIRMSKPIEISDVLETIALCARRPRS